MKRVAISAAAIVATAAVVWAVLSLTLFAGTETRGAAVETLTVDSEAVPGEHPVSVVVPDGADQDSGRPLLVFLHGRSGDSRSYTDEEDFFAALEAQGERAPVVAFPDGGDSSYWHDRADGAWGKYLIEEVVPEIADRFGTADRKVAIGGISMGGFGALNLAAQHPGLFCAAGGHSPALFQSGGESAAGAFDDAADFDRNDVISTARQDPGAFAGTPVWLDAGERDPFVPGVSAMRDALTANGADVTVKSEWRGGHDDGYWNAHWDEYLRFYAKALAEC